MTLVCVCVCVCLGGKMPLPSNHDNHTEGFEAMNRLINNQESVPIKPLTDRLTLTEPLIDAH